MRLTCLALAFSFFSVAILGCASTDVPPLTDESTVRVVDKDEQFLLDLAALLERQLKDKGLILDDPALARYIDEVGQALVPCRNTDTVAFRFAVLRDPTINAFSLANGAVYVHVGLLARLENEAQLAHVLAHEISHTVYRHQLKFLRDYKNKTIAIKLVQLTLAPAAAFFGGVGAASLLSAVLGQTYSALVNGYSRENEKEADLAALRRLADLGYAIDEAPKLFALLKETEDAGALEIFFYGSHPANTTREAYTRELIDTGQVVRPHEGRINAALYQSITEHAALENIELRLRARHYQYALLEAERALKRYGERAQLYYLMGEAHRLTAMDPNGAAREAALRKRKPVTRSLVSSFEKRAPQELREALAAYGRALQLDPLLVKAHRGIGLIAQQRGDSSRAREELQIYLRESAVAPDHRYIECILEELQNAPTTSH